VVGVARGGMAQVEPAGADATEYILGSGLTLAFIYFFLSLMHALQKTTNGESAASQVEGCGLQNG
jgi:hypothetical protein